MSYVEKTLLPDERLLYAAHIHWIIYIPGLAMTAAGGILTHFAPYVMGQIFGADMGHDVYHIAGLAGGFLVLCGLFVLLGAYVRQRTTELAITNHRIIAKYGFISRSTFEIMISRITGANFDQTILGRLLGFGTVIVHGAGGDISPFDVVADPQDFHKSLVAALEQVSPSASPIPANTSSPSHPQQHFRKP